MAQVLKYIDKIAREKQRGVLYVKFNYDFELSEEYKDLEIRKDLLEWLDVHEIGYEKCGPMASEGGWEAYRGQLYIDLVYDKEDHKFQMLEQHLTTEDDKFRIKGIEMYYMPLEKAMENVHHDEEGFWEEWAENF